MKRINIRNILPDPLSDEAAYQLVNFFTELATLLESHYYAQIKRYVDNLNACRLPGIDKEIF